MAQQIARNPTVVIIDEEYEALADVVCGSPRATSGLALLWSELQRATLTPTGRAPSHLVRMGSLVTFTDVPRRETRTVRLVYPDETLQPVRLPVTSQIGAALIGLTAGSEFEWTNDAGETRRVRVENAEPPLTPRIRRRTGARA